MKRIENIEIAAERVEWGVEIEGATGERLILAFGDEAFARANARDGKLRSRVVYESAWADA